MPDDTHDAAPTLLTADAVVTGTDVHRPGWVEITGTQVTNVGAGRPAPGAGEVADLGATTVVPGFVDMHSHGGGGAAFTDATPEAVATATGLHRAHGTTRMMASLVSAHPDELLREVAGLAPVVQEGAVCGIHLEGPWMSPGRLGAHDLGTLRAPDPAEIDRLLEAADGAIRMITLAPELPGAINAVHRFVEAGVVVAVGHTDATYEEARAAIEAGARVGTHLFNAMRPVDHREPGPVVALLEDPRVTVEMITDGVHLHPSVYALACAEAGPDRVVVVTDAMSAAGMTDGRYLLGALDVDVVDGTARVAGTPTIAGSTATMDRLFRFAVAHGGHEGDAALLHAVRQTSTNPARAVGVPGGALVEGSPADLVVLDADLQVRGVMAAGAWVAGA
ncbi:N-acetylglucosamine-6-phosphate deacetylase [Mobilicoccus pelagius]|uniref:N-acetylglucosamine-6-phosphate deacetylase n=1 Tax=Mobilicoccus pelagius NBRC 104925 TaxID=1089455 RepID=H5UVY8_9MICO|nr:N-acetylglucosamine-6-phosphate deacetylase [Mobilicoccus pelagius]GAB49896.1 N-acetylglucosamine-6-phosphate deacetylase [Mobilicoccus pelagius NBRC 104925]